MNHKVQNVQKLYDDSMNLYNKVVRETADSIIDNLKSGISTLKNTWEGKDAMSIGSKCIRNCCKLQINSKC